MRIHRIFTEQALVTGREVVLSPETAHYLSRVLRATAGQPVVLFNGDGHDYAAEISSFARQAVHLVVQRRLPAGAESPLRLTLVQAVSRGERMDLTLQKATELGVHALQPVFTARTEVRLQGDKLNRRMEHWRKVVIAACEQSGRSRLPELLEPADLLVWTQREAVAGRLVLAPGASRSLAAVSHGPAVELIVGPEGGFEDFELEALQRHGAEPVSLGPRILRTETAGPAAIAILQALAGDMA